MITIPNSDPTVKFNDALLAAANRAMAAKPQDRAKIQKGLALVQADAVTDLTRIRPRQFAVRSEADQTRSYTVTSYGHTVCTCPDYGRHGTYDNGYLCKHGYAVLLVRSIQRDAQEKRLYHAYHAASGEEGHGRRLVGNRAVFHPGGHKYSFVCDMDELCFGPEVEPAGRP